MRSASFACGLVVATMFLMTAVASADDDCTGTVVGAAFEGNLRAEGDCRLFGSTVAGNVVVAEGANLIAFQTTFEGNVVAEPDSAFVVVAFSQVKGNVELLGNASEVQVGFSTVEGNVIATENRGFVQIFLSAIDGNIEIYDNELDDLVFIPEGLDSPVPSGFYPPEIVIGQNVINGNLVCSGNDPAPQLQSTINPVLLGPNTIEGSATGQCEGF